VVEGIYANTGDVAPLAAIAALKHKCADLLEFPLPSEQRVACNQRHLHLRKLTCVEVVVVILLTRLYCSRAAASWDHRKHRQPATKRRELSAWQEAPCASSIGQQPSQLVVCRDPRRPCTSTGWSWL
jgi:hypothetical protein